MYIYIYIRQPIGPWPFQILLSLLKEVSAPPNPLPWDPESAPQYHSEPLGLPSKNYLNFGPQKNRQKNSIVETLAPKTLHFGSHFGVLFGFGSKSEK